MARLLSLVAATAILVAAVVAVNPMPYRPGYGLGSFVPDAVVNSMRREADTRAEMQLLSNLDNDAASLAQEVLLASNPLMAQGSNFADQNVPPALSQDQATAALNSIQNTRAQIWQMKLNAFTDLTNQMLDQVNSLKAAANNDQGTGIVSDGGFTTFASSVESAVNWGTSLTGSVERAFDSIDIDVEFIRAEQNDQTGQGSSHNSAVSRYLSRNMNNASGAMTAVQAEAAKRAQDQSQNFNSQYQIEGTLVLRSFATHRNVLQFSRLDVNADRLWRAWNYMRSNDSVADPLGRHGEFTQQIIAEQQRDPSTASRISMVSEMFKGSAMIGLVHFVNVSKTNMSDSGSQFRKMSNVTGANSSYGDNSYQNYSAYASRANETIQRLTQLGSNAGLEVHFSLVCVGYIPQLNTNQVQLAVNQLSNFDPAKFIVPSMFQNADTTTMMNAVQSNMASVIGATIGAVGQVDAANRDKILDANSFMDAFTNYAQAAQSATQSLHIGAPVGYNMRTFTKLDVLSALANKYLDTGVRVAVDVTTDDNTVPPAGFSQATGGGTTQ